MYFYNISTTILTVPVQRCKNIDTELSLRYFNVYFGALFSSFSCSFFCITWDLYWIKRDEVERLRVAQHWFHILHFHALLLREAEGEDKAGKVRT